MASNNQTCSNDANFAVICAFLKRFGTLCGIEYPNVCDLEKMIENTDEVSSALQDLLVKLLRKNRYCVHLDKWERSLIKFCYTYSNQDAWEIERFGYKKSTLSVKLCVMKRLLENQFDINNKLKTALNGISPTELRAQPLGRDRYGNAYWSIIDEKTCKIKLYQENADEETWRLVANDREEFAKLIERLAANERVMPSLIGVVDEDSSSNSMSAATEINGQKTEESKAKVEVPAKEEIILPPAVEKKENEKEIPKENIILKIQKNKAPVVEEESDSSEFESGETEDDSEEGEEEEEEEEEEEKTPNPTKIDESQKARPSLLASKPPSSKMTLLPTTSKRPIERTDDDSNKKDKTQRLTLLGNKNLSQAKVDSGDDEEMDEEEEAEEEEDVEEEESEEGDEDEVGESIEDPVLHVQGAGSGKSNKSVFYPPPSTSDDDKLEFSETIEEEIQFFCGQGSGAECDVGNTGEETEKVDSETKTKPMFFFGQPGCLKLNPIKPVTPTSSPTKNVDDNKTQESQSVEPSSSKDDGKSEVDSNSKTLQPPIPQIEITEAEDTIPDGNVNDDENGSLLAPGSLSSTMVTTDSSSSILDRIQQHSAHTVLSHITNLLNKENESKSVESSSVARSSSIISSVTCAPRDQNSPTKVTVSRWDVRSSTGPPISTVSQISTSTKSSGIEVEEKLKLNPDIIEPKVDDKKLDQSTPDTQKKVEEMRTSKVSIEVHKNHDESKKNIPPLKELPKAENKLEKLEKSEPVKQLEGKNVEASSFISISNSEEKILPESILKSDRNSPTMKAIGQENLTQLTKPAMEFKLKSPSSTKKPDSVDLPKSELSCSEKVETCITESDSTKAVPVHLSSSQQSEGCSLAAKQKVQDSEMANKDVGNNKIEITANDKKEKELTISTVIEKSITPTAGVHKTSVKINEPTKVLAVDKSESFSVGEPTAVKDVSTEIAVDRSKGAEVEKNTPKIFSTHEKHSDVRKIVNEVDLKVKTLPEKTVDPSSKTHKASTTVEPQTKPAEKLFSSDSAKIKPQSPPGHSNDKQTVDSKFEKLEEKTMPTVTDKLKEKIDPPKVPEKKKEATVANFEKIPEVSKHSGSLTIPKEIIVKSANSTPSVREKCVITQTSINPATIQEEIPKTNKGDVNLPVSKDLVIRVAANDSEELKEKKEIKQLSPEVPKAESSTIEFKKTPEIDLKPQNKVTTGSVPSESSQQEIITSTITKQESPNEIVKSSAEKVKSSATTSISGPEKLLTPRTPVVEEKSLSSNKSVENVIESIKTTAAELKPVKEIKATVLSKKFDAQSLDSGSQIPSTPKKETHKESVPVKPQTISSMIEKPKVNEPTVKVDVEKVDQNKTLPQRPNKTKDLTTGIPSKTIETSKQQTVRPVEKVSGQKLEDKIQKLKPKLENKSVEQNISLPGVSKQNDVPGAKETKQKIEITIPSKALPPKELFKRTEASKNAIIRSMNESVPVTQSKITEGQQSVKLVQVEVFNQSTPRKSEEAEKPKIPLSSSIQVVVEPSKTIKSQSGVEPGLNPARIVEHEKKQPELSSQTKSSPPELVEQKKTVNAPREDVINKPLDRNMEKTVEHGKQVKFPVISSSKTLAGVTPTTEQPKSVIAPKIQTREELSINSQDLEKRPSNPPEVISHLQPTGSKTLMSVTPALVEQTKVAIAPQEKSIPKPIILDAAKKVEKVTRPTIERTEINKRAQSTDISTSKPSTSATPELDEQTTITKAPREESISIPLNLHTDKKVEQAPMAPIEQPEISEQAKPPTKKASTSVTPAVVQHTKTSIVPREESITKPLERNTTKKEDQAARPAVEQPQISKQVKAVVSTASTSVPSPLVEQRKDLLVQRGESMTKPLDLNTTEKVQQAVKTPVEQSEIVKQAQSTVIPTSKASTTVTPALVEKAKIAIAPREDSITKPLDRNTAKIVEQAAKAPVGHPEISKQARSTVTKASTSVVHALVQQTKTLIVPREETITKPLNLNTAKKVETAAEAPIEHSDINKQGKATVTKASASVAPALVQQTKTLIVPREETITKPLDLNTTKKVEHAARPNVEQPDSSKRAQSRVVSTSKASASVAPELIVHSKSVVPLTQTREESITKPLELNTAKKVQQAAKPHIEQPEINKQAKAPVTKAATSETPVLVQQSKTLIDRREDSITKPLNLNAAKTLELMARPIVEQPEIGKHVKSTVTKSSSSVGPAVVQQSKAVIVPREASITKPLGLNTAETVGKLTKPPVEQAEISNRAQSTVISTSNASTSLTTALVEQPKSLVAPKIQIRKESSLKALEDEEKTAEEVLVQKQIDINKQTKPPVMLRSNTSTIATIQPANTQSSLNPGDPIPNKNSVAKIHEDKPVKRVDEVKPQSELSVSPTVKSPTSVTSVLVKPANTSGRKNTVEHAKVSPNKIEELKNQQKISNPTKFSVTPTTKASTNVERIPMKSTETKEVPMQIVEDLKHKTPSKAAEDEKVSKLKQPIEAKPSILTLGKSPMTPKATEENMSPIPKGSEIIKQGSVKLPVPPKKSICAVKTEIVVQPMLKSTLTQELPKVTSQQPKDTIPKQSTASIVNLSKTADLKSIEQHKPATTTHGLRSTQAAPAKTVSSAPVPPKKLYTQLSQSLAAKSSKEIPETAVEIKPAPQTSTQLLSTQINRPLESKKEEVKIRSPPKKSIESISAKLKSAQPKPDVIIPQPTKPSAVVLNLSRDKSEVEKVVPRNVLNVKEVVPTKETLQVAAHSSVDVIEKPSTSPKDIVVTPPKTATRSTRSKPIPETEVEDTKPMVRSTRSKPAEVIPVEATPPPPTRSRRSKIEVKPIENVESNKQGGNRSRSNQSAVEESKKVEGPVKPVEIDKPNEKGVEPASQAKAEPNINEEQKGKRENRSRSRSNQSVIEEQKQVETTAPGATGKSAEIIQINEHEKSSEKDVEVQPTETLKETKSRRGNRSQSNLNEELNKEEKNDATKPIAATPVESIDENKKESPVRSLRSKPEAKPIENIEDVPQTKRENRSRSNQSITETEKIEKADSEKIPKTEETINEKDTSINDTPKSSNRATRSGKVGESIESEIKKNDSKSDVEETTSDKVIESPETEKGNDDPKSLQLLSFDYDDQIPVIKLPIKKALLAMSQKQDPLDVSIEKEKLTTPEKRKSGQRKRRVDVEPSLIIETGDNESETPVRQSRRIAQLKIREEEERRKLEEMVLKQLKADANKKKKEEQIAKGIEPVEEEEPESVEEISEEDTSIKKKKERKKKKEKKGNAIWHSSGTSDSDDEEEEEDGLEREYEEPALVFKSDHEFSPESDMEDAEAVPLKRARTVKRDEDSDFDDSHEHACQKCSKQDHPEWILLCDSCDKGYHCSCLTPVLFIIPEGDWFCPPCQHTKLIESLNSHLAVYDELIRQKEAEENRQKRALFTDVNVGNVLDGDDKTSTRRKNYKFDDEDDDSDDEKMPKENRANRSRKRNQTRRRRQKNASSTSSEASSSGSESDPSKGSTASSDDSDAPIYKLRKRRQANVSYRFNEYDALINRAIKDETFDDTGFPEEPVEEEKTSENLGRGKDISTILEADKEEKAKVEVESSVKEEKPVDKSSLNEGEDMEPQETSVHKPAVSRGKHLDSDSDDEPLGLKTTIIRKKKSRKLNSLDIESDDDGSDEDFKGSSSDDEEEEFSASSASESSLEKLSRKRKKKNRKPALRERRRDRTFINDNDSDDDSNIKPTTSRKKRKRADSDFSDFDDDEDEDEEDIDSDDLCDTSNSDSDSNSDGAWRPAKKKKAKKSKPTKPKATLAAIRKNLTSGGRKKARKVDDDEKPFRAGVTIKKKKTPAKTEEDSEDSESERARKTRGRRYAYLDDFDDSSDDGIRPGVKRPDTPPEERALFIKKQEEIKRMLAAKNTDAAKQMATPVLKPLGKEGGLVSNLPSDSISTIPRQIIQNAKALDADYLSRKNPDLIEDFDELPEDFNPEDMDEDEIAKMMEEEDFAQQQLKLAGEQIRNKRKKEEEEKIGKELMDPTLTATPAIVQSLPAQLPTPAQVVSGIDRKRGRKIKEIQTIGEMSSSTRVASLSPQPPSLLPPQAHPVIVPPHSHPSMSPLTQLHHPPLSPHMPLNLGPMGARPMPVQQGETIFTSMSGHLVPNHPSGQNLTSLSLPPRLIPPPNVSVVPKSTESQIPTTVLAVQPTLAVPPTVDPSRSGDYDSPIKKRGRRKKITPLRDPTKPNPGLVDLSNSAAAAATAAPKNLTSTKVDSAEPTKVTPILAERLTASSPDSKLTVAAPPQLFARSGVATASVITRLPQPPRPHLGSPYGQGGPIYYPPMSASSHHPIRPPYVGPPSGDGALPHPPGPHYIGPEQHPRPPGPPHMYRPPMYGPHGYPPPPGPIHHNLQPVGQPGRIIRPPPALTRDYPGTHPPPYIPPSQYGGYYPPPQQAVPAHIEEPPVTTSEPAPFSNASDSENSSTYSAPPPATEEGTGSSEFSGLVSYFSSQQDDLDT